MAQFPLKGEERPMLVDTDLANTPEASALPFVDATGSNGPGPDIAPVSHVDVDHCGGNSAIRQAFGSLFAAHGLSREWIEHTAAMMDGSYLWYRDFGFGPDDESVTWIEEQLGGDVELDLVFAGGELFQLGDRLEVEVLHLPRHTAGHVGLWDERTGTAIIVDAILERDVCDRAGELLILPCVYDIDAYRETICRAQALDPDLLLTAHFPVMRGTEAAEFLERSVAFVDDLGMAVDAARGEDLTGLRDITRHVDQQLGPYPASMFELAAAVS